GPSSGNAVSQNTDRIGFAHTVAAPAASGQELRDGDALHQRKIGPRPGAEGGGPGCRRAPYQFERTRVFRRAAVSERGDAVGLREQTVLRYQTGARLTQEQLAFCL